MATYTATAKTFRNGCLIEVGQSIKAAGDPGEPFVLAATYKAADPQPTQVTQPSGFVVRGPDGELIPQGIATRLEGRSPGERSY